MSESEIIQPTPTKSSRKSQAITESPTENLESKEITVYVLINQYLGTYSIIGAFTLDTLLSEYKSLKENAIGEYIDRDDNGNGLTAIPYTLKL